MREIAATKAYTIGRRGAYKDYIDLYFILSEQHATPTDIIDAAEKKFGFQFNSRLFLEQIVFLDDVEDTDIQFLKQPSHELSFSASSNRIFVPMRSAFSSLVRDNNKIVVVG